MKISKKFFFCLEAFLAIIVILLAVVMLREHIGKECRKISVILQNSDANGWSAFKYGLKMAAEDQKVEMFVVSTGNGMTVHEETDLIRYEIDNGADAVIVQPVPGTDAEAKLKKLAKKVPVMLVESTASEDREASALPVTEPDNYAMGKTLAEEILADYSGSMLGKTIGIMMADDSSEAAKNREQGFRDVLEKTDARILWSVAGSFREPEKNSLESLPRVNLVIALDDPSLITAGEYSSLNNLHGALVYGIGNSTEAVYYLDTGIVGCLVVPDEFITGYQSLTEVVTCLGHPFRKMKGQMVEHTVIRRNELFSEENQDMLFTMSQ